MTYQPVTALVVFVRHQIREVGLRCIVLSSLDIVGKLSHLLNSIGLEQVLVVEMVEQDVQSLLGIGNVLPVLCWSLGLDTLQVGLKDLIDGTRRVGNVRPVTGSYCMLVYSGSLRRSLCTLLLVGTYGTWPQLAQSFVTERWWAAILAVAVRSGVHLKEDQLVGVLEADPLVAVQQLQAAFVEPGRVHMATQQG